MMLAGLGLLAGCGGGAPKLFWDVDEGGPAYARDAGKGGVRAESRKHLEVPPELRAQIEVPMSEQVASSSDAALPDKYREIVAGKAVSLHARVYPVAAAELFSAVVDAMTSLNLPVDSVDSPSGIVTTEWVRKGANNPSITAMFGIASSSDLTRYRYVVRVFRARLPDGRQASKLEIRTLGQLYQNGHWVNQPLKRKLADELFERVEEVLGFHKRMDAGAQNKSTEVPESE